MYGNEITKGATYAGGKPVRASVIGDVTLSPFGNVVLRVGNTQTPDGSWQQTEHVVLTDVEWGQFVDEVNELRAVRRLKDQGLIGGAA